MNVIDEIMKLPNLGYVYEKENGKSCIVVLGGESCPPSDQYDFWQNISEYNNRLMELYGNKPFSEEVREAIYYYMKKMRAVCDSRMRGTYSPAQQKAYLDALDSNERQQIEEQVLMYTECYAIYLDKVRRR